MKNQLKLLFTAGSIAICLSCNNSDSFNHKKVTDTSVEKKDGHKEISKDVTAALDSVLMNCRDYAWFDDGWFRTAYSGYVYDPELNPQNKIGWCDVVLICNQSDKVKLQRLSDSAMDRQITIVNKMDLVNIKDSFNPIIFVVDKTYLRFNKDLELRYAPNLPYLRKMYQYIKSDGRWHFSDSIMITKEEDDSRWKDEKLARAKL